MTDFLFLKELLSNCFLCHSLITDKDIKILFSSQQDNFYYYQKKEHYSCVLLSNDNINYKLVGFAENCSSCIVVNNDELTELIKEFFME